MRTLGTYLTVILLCAIAYSGGGVQACERDYPRELKVHTIGGEEQTYKITYTAEKLCIPGERGRKWAITTCGDVRHIAIWTGIPNDELIGDVLLHEGVHAVMGCYDTPQPVTVHDAIHSLSPVYASVLAHNPQLQKFLAKHAHKKALPVWRTGGDPGHECETE